MYFLDERIKAVRLYIQYDYSAAAVMRELGYPKSRHSIYAWYNEFQMDEELHVKCISSSKFTDEQRHTAVKHFLEHGRCVSRTVKKPGYPSRTTLSSWLEEDVPGYTNRKGVRSGTFLVQLNQSQKEQAVKTFVSEKDVHNHPIIPMRNTITTVTAPTFLYFYYATNTCNVLRHMLQK